MLRRARWLRISPAESYENFIRMGIIREDDRQRAAVRQVERVYNDLVAFKRGPKASVKRDVEIRPPNRLGIIPMHLMKKEEAARQRLASGEVPFHPLSDVKGLYMYGGVGCGKTYLMDILYNEAPMDKKLRVHFHQFMLNVHQTMHQIRSQNRSKEAQVDLFDELAQRLVTNAELLCFDELVISDISDAMIMKRLFTSFYKIGVCAVFTSNRAPTDLYKGGLNRESFLPFIRMLNDRCVVYDMQSDTDYRLTGENAQTYLAPFSDENDARFNKMLRAVTKGDKMGPKNLRVFGRDVPVSLAADGVCRFTFAEICGGEMSTADYSVIAKTFHTMFLDAVPNIGPNDSDVKRRFIALIDTLYQYHVKLVIYAECAPDLLEASPSESSALLGRSGSGADQVSAFEIGSLINDKEGQFQMQRTVSRLHEMGSTGYLEAPHAFEEVALDTE